MPYLVIIKFKDQQGRKSEHDDGIVKGIDSGVESI